MLVYFHCRFHWTIISHIVLLPNLSRLKRMGYGEEKNIITLVVTASVIVEIITSITDGLLLYMYFNSVYIFHDSMYSFNIT